LSYVQTVILGGLAGLTILLGLPVARQLPPPRCKVPRYCGTNVTLLASMTHEG